jgi:1-acyl-sn-glycerol-3-phosphate acyltransferase
MTLLARLGQKTARFCFGKLGRLELIGRELVPPHGPLIVVANHLSFSDPPLLVCGIDRPLYFIAKRELFSNPITGFLMRGFQVHPFDRSGSRVEALRLVLRLLEQDRAVVVFPEGHRSPDHTMKEGMLGVAYLAMKSRATILPVGLSGTEKISAWRMTVPLCRMRANIGQPFTPTVMEGAPGREATQNVLDMIMNRIAALLPEQYRGVYAATAARDAGAAAAVASQASEAGRGAIAP